MRSISPKTIATRIHTEVDGRHCSVLRRTLPAASLLLLTLLVCPGPSRADRPIPHDKPAVNAEDAGAAVYTLQPVFKVGDVARYKLVVHRTSTRPKAMDLDVSDIQFNMLTKDTVTDIAANGETTFTTETEQADGDFDGREIELTAAIPKVTQIRDKQGKVTVKVEGGVDLVQNQISQMFELLGRLKRSFVPANPVHVGDTWKIDFQDAGAFEGHSEGTGTLVGAGVVNGKPTWKVKADYKGAYKVPNPRAAGDKIDVTVHFTGNADLDATTFQIVQLHGITQDQLPNSEVAKSEYTFDRLPNMGQKDTSQKDTKAKEPSKATSPDASKETGQQSAKSGS